MPMTISTTELICQLLVEKPKVKQEELLNQARRALLDYLGCLANGQDLATIKNLRANFILENGDTQILGTNQLTTAERAALINGYTAHYLDYDDVQANFRGHPSVVIFSALFAVARPQDQLQDLLWAYIEGVELAGQLGKQLQPQHTLSGWHSTGTIGALAAAGALSVFKGLSKQQTACLLSITASQSAGMLFQAGSDSKPLQAGLAARNVVIAYKLLQAGLTANSDPFNPVNGWAQTIAGVTLNQSELEQTWLRPGQIIVPGLWFKQYQFCSAAMAGYDAAKQLWQQGVRLSNCEQVICHFPPNGDRVLNQRRPKTGQQGKFSIEYIVWQVLTFGDVDDTLFGPAPVTDDFYTQVIKIKHENDLPKAEKSARPTVITAIQQNRHYIAEVQTPKGTPLNPLTLTEICTKLVHSHAEQISKLIMGKQGTIKQLSDALQ